MVKEMCTEHLLVPDGFPENSAVNLHSIAVVRVRLKVLMQPDKRKFSCIAANIYDVQNYAGIDQKCHEITCFFVSAQISIDVVAQPISAHSFIALYVQLLVSVGLINN